MPTVYPNCASLHLCSVGSPASCPWPIHLGDCPPNPSLQKQLPVPATLVLLRCHPEPPGSLPGNSVAQAQSPMAEGGSGVSVGGPGTGAEEKGAGCLGVGPRGLGHPHPI